MDIIYILTALVLIGNPPVAEVHKLAAFGTLYECETVLKEAEKELIDTVDINLTCVETSIHDKG